MLATIVFIRDPKELGHRIVETPRGSGIGVLSYLDLGLQRKQILYTRLNCSKHKVSQSVTL
jgi:hypothetical protein